MKAIRGDNPRTTNQRVYLMPVVPPPPPENPRCPTWNSFPSLSRAFSPLSLSLSTRFSFSVHLSIYLSLGSSRTHSPSFFLSSSFYLSVSPLARSLALSFILSVHHATRPSRHRLSTPCCHPSLLAPTSSRCCSRICHYATDITNPLSPLAPLRGLSRALYHPTSSVSSSTSPRSIPACYLQRVVRSRTPAI